VERRLSLLGPPTLSGLTLGPLFWVAASAPTLIPRSWAVQAAVSGVSFAIGLSTPPGFGHGYANDYVDGWAEVIPPEGWTHADTARLTSFLDTGHGEAEP
jgi:uncharacterized membrane protein